MRGNYASPSELLLALRETGKSYWDLIGKPLNQNTGYNLNNPHAAEEKQYNEWYDSLKLSDEDNIKLQQLLSEYDKNVKSNTDSLPKYKKGKDKFRSFAAQMGPRIYRELHKQGIYSSNTYDNMMRLLAWESNYANSLNAINNHNYAGIRRSATKYAKYKNDDLFAQEYVSLIKRKYPNAVKAKNPVLYAKALKDNGYYEDSVEHYALSLAAMSSISNAVKAHMAANPSQYEVEVLLEDLKKQSELPAVSTRVAKPINREPINKEPFVNTPIPTEAPLITRPEYLESNSLIKKSFELNMNNMLLGKEFLFKLPGFRGGKDSDIKEYASNEDMHVNPDGSVTTRNGNTGNVILPDVNVYAQKDYNSAFDYSGANKVMGTIADFTPVVGDIKQGLEAANDLRKGNYKEAAIGAGLLLLPNVLEKPLKYAGKYLLGRLAKPMFNKTAMAIENYRYPLGRPQVPENFLTIKPQVRTKVGDVEINNPELYYHQSDAGKAKNFVSTGRMRTPLEEYWLAKEEAGEKIPLALHIGAKPGYPQDPGSAMFSQGNLWYGLTTNKPDLLVTAREMPIANKNASIMSNKASLRKLEEQGTRRVTNDNIYTQGPHNRQNTTAYTWEPGYGYKKVFAEETHAAKWPVGRTTPEVTAENAASITPEQWTAAQDAAIAKALNITPEEATSLTKEQLDAAIANGADMAEAQRLRNSHYMTKAPNTSARYNSYTPTLLQHGTDIPNHYVFGNRLSFFNTHGGYNKKYRQNVYVNVPKLRVTNPKGYEIGHEYDLLLDADKGLSDGFVELGGTEITEAEENYLMNNMDKVFGITPEEYRKLYETLPNYKDPSEIQLLKNDYPFIQFQQSHIDKEGIGEWYPLVSELAVKNPKNIKLADAVTFDDNGVRIPLGERDNFKLNEIRYGILPFGVGLTGYGLLNNHKTSRGSARKGNTKK